MVTITTTTEAKPFPKLMKSKSGSIVFFTETQKGLWIKAGIWYDYWAMEGFEDYNEAVTIINK